MRPLACLVLTLSLACACKPKASPPQPPALEVAFAGCVEIVGDVCFLDESGVLRFWVQGTLENVQATSDAGAPEVQTSLLKGGTFISVKVPSGASTLDLVAPGALQKRMRLNHWQELEILATARALAKTNLQAARLHLEKALPGAVATVAPHIRSLLGRIHMQAGRYDEATALLEGSAEAYDSLGLSMSASKDRLALTFIASTRQNNATLALQLLHKAASINPQARDLRAEIDYQRGLVESMVGNVRGALVFVKQALLWGERLQMQTLEIAAQQWLAMTLSSLGRVNEALTIQSQLVSKGPANPCVLAPVLATAAWLSLLQKPLDAAQAERRLNEARDALQTCPDPFRDRNQTINEISFFLTLGKFVEAQRALQRLQDRAEGRTASLSVLELELRGRVALASRSASRALDAFDRAEILANAAGLGDEALRMRVWRAQALAEKGHTRDAVDLLEDAEHILDQRLQLVPVGEGRVRFVQMRDQGVRALMNLHLRAGDVRKAFDVARRGRSRALRALALGERLAGLRGDARLQWLSDIAEYQRLRANAEESSDTWSLSQSDLNAQAELKAERNKRAQEALDRAYARLVANLPGEHRLQPLALDAGEVALLFVKEPGTSAAHAAWRGFAASANDVKTAVLVAPSMRLSDHPWLLPFADLIAKASRIRVLFTDVATEEIHTATFKQKPLQTHAPVAYSLDISSAASASGPAFVVADPTGDLPASRDEGRDVGTVLGVATSGRMLLGGASTRDAVIASLSASRWFHYAGHSIFAGEEGLDSGLPLAGQQRLLATDVLSLPAVPEFVILSACEAGRSSGDSNTAGLGLAQAFVVAGAKVVIAPTQPVSDVISRAFMQKFYKHVSIGLPPERALQATLFEANAQQQNEWSTFRALVP